MTKSRVKHGAGVTATDSSRNPRVQPASVTGSDIARRAYDLYLARGCEHGHDVDDWLQAERELGSAAP